MSYLYPPPQFALHCQITSSNRIERTDIPVNSPVFYSITVDNPVGYTYLTNPNSNFQGQDEVQVGLDDVKIGDWIGTQDGQGVAFLIVEKIDLNEYTIADIDGWCLRVKGGPIYTQGDVCIFRVNEDSIPMFGNLSLGSGASFFSIVSGSYDPLQWVADMVGRFAFRNSKSQYVTVYQPLGKGGPAANLFVLGESIYIDENGVFQKSAGSALGVSDTIGIVTSKSIPSDDWFSFRPSGKYFDKSRGPDDFFPTPEIIEQVGEENVTLIAGTKLYINPNSGRQYTTVPPNSNPYATWIMIDENRAIYIAGSGGGGGGGGTTAVQVFDGGDPYWVSAPPTTIWPVLDCGGI